MSPVVHGLVAWLIALSLTNKTNDRRLIIIAGVAADIDGIFILFNHELFSIYHHTFGHSLIFGCLIAITAGTLTENKMKIGIGASIAFVSHLILDLIGGNLPISILYPLDPTIISLNNYLSKEIMYNVINPITFIIILFIVFIITYIYEISPIEFISKKLDEKIVAFYVYPIKYKCEFCGNLAFNKCEKCKRKVCVNHLDSIFKFQCSKCKKELDNI